MIEASLDVLNVYPSHPIDAAWPWVLFIDYDFTQLDEYREWQLLFLARYFRTILGTVITEDTDVTELTRWVKAGEEFLESEGSVRKALESS